MDRRTWLAAVLTALAGWAATANAQAVRSAPPVATVNGVTISQAELDAVLRAGEPEAVPQPAAQRRQRQVEALALLIDGVLMRQYLDKHALRVPAAELTRRLNEMKTGLEAQGKSIAEFCHDTNQTEEQFRAGVADHLRWSAYVATKLTDVAVEQYHKDNRDFFDGAKVEASHIVLRVPPSAPEKDKAEAKAKLQSLRKQLTEGKADFAELARKYSQDPRAAQGGEVGSAFPRRCELDEPFCKAAFALNEGEVSDVVETDYGYHLIKVTKRHAGTPSDFAKIKEIVREVCAEDERQKILAEERKKSEIKIDLP
jgi:parvulin-like peptidyl-prolyl isomerase